MRQPLHSSHEIGHIIREYFNGAFEGKSVAIMTWNGRVIEGRPKAHFATEGFYNLCIVETSPGVQEVIYEGDIWSVRPLGYHASGGSNRRGGAAPLLGNNQITQQLNLALEEGREVRLHFANSTYTPSGKVVEHLQSEEGGWFCVGLLGVHDNEPKYVGHYYTPTIKRVEIL